MKRCCKCKDQKALSEFNKRFSGKNGLRAECRKCQSNYAKKYYRIHKIKRIKQMKEYRKTFMGSLRRRFDTIKQRCNNPYSPDYKYYGSRGIKCLFESSDEFIDYIFNELQIDRIDNNGHYERGNIRLTTAKENSNNRRGRKHI